MNSVIIGTLIISVLFLAFRWTNSKAEVAELRVQVASLKRQLAKRA